MELLIVRHAIACERNAQRWPEDDERPLTPRGALRARQAARGARRIAPRPVRVLVSPLLRARQTAAILSKFAAWPRPSLCALLTPEASPTAVLALLSRSQESCVALVGHQPALGRLMASCLSSGARGASFELRKMGMALVRFEGAPRAAAGELVWLVPPRVLRALR